MANSEPMSRFRVYADGGVYPEDEWGTLPEDYSDDFAEFCLPIELVDYLLSC